MSTIKFMFKVVAKNPPMGLFVLAAFVLFMGTITANTAERSWFWPLVILGVLLQIAWLALEYGKEHY